MFELLVQLIIELVGEFLIGVGWELIRAEQAKPKRSPDPLAAALGFLFAGGAFGALSGVFLPWRFSQNDGVSLFGVFANALAFGALMSIYGSRRARAGKPRTSFSTFWGGAAFAFGLAGARLAVIIAMA